VLGKRKDISLAISQEKRDGKGKEIAGGAEKSALQALSRTIKLARLKKYSSRKKAIEDVTNDYLNKPNNKSFSVEGSRTT
jgi:hypothetical protein